MFGDFPAAEEFHGALGEAHGQHVRRLQAHQEVLTAIGNNAHSAATAFTDNDDHNAAALRIVGCRTTT
jgi:uncharacterized protein YukE